MTRWSKERESAPLLFALGSGPKKKPRPFRLDASGAAPSVTEARKLLALQPARESNYFTNTKPGIWIFSRPEDLEVIASNCEKYGYPIPSRLTKSISATLGGVFLPQGGFVTFPYYGSIQFWQRQGITEIKGTGEQERENRGLFSVGVNRVVRIAGKSSVSGEVWQNPRYLTDGQLNPKFSEGEDVAALGRD